MHYGTQTVTMDEATEWARGEGIYIPAKGTLQAINAARTDQGLPRFVLRGSVLAEGRASPMPPAEGTCIIHAPSLRTSPPVEPEKPCSQEPDPEPSAEPEIAEHIPAAIAQGLPNQITGAEMADFTRRIRTTLFAEIDDLRSGKATPQRSQAVAKLVQQAIAAVRLEVDFVASTSRPRMLEGSPS